MREARGHGRLHQEQDRRLIRGLLCGGALLAMAGAARAQTPTPATSPQTPPPPTANQVSEVVVTANKRAERLLDVAAPVTALTASELFRIQAVRLEDFAAKVPGLNLISDREGETQIVIRGITTGSPVSSTVSTYIDDTPYGSSTTQALGGFLSPDLDPSDLQRIEVLKGPQGTLYGASSLGGLVKYVTTQPNVDSYGARIEVDGSSVDHGGDGYGVRGMINLPLLKDTLGLRISAYDRRDPGYISDPQLGRTDVNSSLVDGGRASLLWTPLSQLSVNLTAVIQDLKNRGSNDEDVNVNGDHLNQNSGNLTQIRFTPEPLNVRYRLYSSTVNYDLHFADLVSITSYSTQHEVANVDQTDAFGGLVGEIFSLPTVGTSVGSELRLHKVTEEVRLQSRADQKFEWRLGFFYTHEKANRDEPSSAFDYVTQTPYPIPSLFFSSLDSSYTEYAGFADATYHFTDRLDLSAGLRYSQNHQDFTQFSSGLLAGGDSTVSQTSSDSTTTFQVTPRFKLDRDNMLYARVASGYRPGGPNAITVSQLAAGVPSAFKPDTLTDYDIGYKASLLQHRLTLELSAFHIDWKDIQILTDFAGITSEGNGGDAKSDGAEFAATLTPVRGLNLSANLAYTQANLTQDAPGVNGHDGDRLPNVPRWAANVGADYDMPLTNDLTGFVGGDVRYLGDRVSGFVTGSPADFVRPPLPSFTTVDLRAGVEFKTYTIEAYVKNIGDERGFNNVSSEALSGYSAPFTASVIQPRTVGLSVSARY